MRVTDQNRILLKDEYLASKHVTGFSKFLSEYMNDSTKEFKHNYRNIKKNTEWKCDKLANAFQHYEWRVKDCFSNIATGESFESNNKVLLFLRARLENYILNKSPRDLKNAAIDVMKWGGTVNGNKPFIDELYTTNKIINYFKDAITFFSKDSFDEDQFKTLKLRSNAGFTKIYSLLNNNFIIYDSRVAAALTLLVLSYCKNNDLKCVPVELLFCVMPAKEDKKAQHHKCRNPSQQTLNFPMMNNNHLVHARSNVMANWLIECSLAKGGFLLNGKGSDDFRALEAALFMIGYDLSHSTILQ